MPYSVKREEYGSYFWLRREVGTAMELKPDSALWSNTDHRAVDSVIERGLGLFYHPSPSEFTIPNATEAQKERLRRAPHEWSFMQQIVSFDTVSNQSEYDLPPGFSKFIGEPTTGRTSGRIAIVNEQYIRQMLSVDTETGDPAYCAIRPEYNGGQSIPRYKLLLYPTPGSVETIQVQYGVMPPVLNEDAPWPISPREHAQTILACCLYVINPERYAAQMVERVTASVLMDQATATATADGIWPSDDADEMGAGRGYYEKHIGIKLGYGPNVTVWTDAQQKKVQEVYKQGVRLFVNPPVLPGERTPHQWGFLMPDATLTTESGTYTYDLPLDMAWIDGPLTYAPGSNTIYPAIKQRSEHQVKMRLQVTQNGRPLEYAIRPKAYSPSVGTRYEMLLWPIPDGAYTLHYRYRISPDALAG